MSAPLLSISALEQDRALAALIPHTTSTRGSRFEVNVPVKFLRAGVFDAQNIITAPDAKLVRRLRVLSAEQLAAVERAVEFWLGLESEST